ncbi:hypothetical protein H6P81_017375 [Aristolochia fimbriata]|uniref:Uncharacterized protein n=1 Tax=Aristolochia fimbriata TaxID=158543 RepID=A0AAV7E0V4_ARIFI|nr:hypothetical protein H6P81_017375 [Aristolochia fimbriata]
MAADLSQSSSSSPSAMTSLVLSVANAFSSVLNSQNLTGFVDGAIQPPAKYVKASNLESLMLNPSCSRWYQLDHTIVSWIGLSRQCRMLLLGISWSGCCNVHRQQLQSQLVQLDIGAAPSANVATCAHGSSFGGRS